MANAFPNAPINVAAMGNTTLVPAIAGKRVLVLAYYLYASGTVNVQFQDTLGTVVDGPYDYIQGAGVVLPACPWNLVGGYVQPWFGTGTGLGLAINLSAAVQVSGQVLYRYLE